MTKVARIISALVLVAGVSAAPASANLITNPGFETGDFTGWTQGGNLGFTFVNGLPHSGTYAAWLGPIGSNGTLSQTVATVPGHSYNFSFWLQSDGETPNFFKVAFGGSSFTFPINFAVPYPYSEFNFTGVATSNSTTLSFTFRNDPGYFQLDDIEVVDAAVPEPGTLLLLGSGLTGLAMRRRRRNS